MGGGMPEEIDHDHLYGLAWNPMTLMAPYGQRMTDAERQALWSFLQSVPAVSKTITR